MSIGFSKKLRELRKERNLNQREIAEHLSYGYTAICNYERNKNEPSLDDLVRLADFFQVSTDYLLDRKNCKKSVFLEEFNHFYSCSSPVERKIIENIYLNLKTFKIILNKDKNKKKIG